jgi:hypothetical protein
MTAAGWISLLIGVGGISSLLFWCVLKIIRTPAPHEHLHSPADIDTRDLES